MEEFDAMVERYRRCEKDARERQAIREGDWQRDRERAEIHWKFEHELQLDWYRRDGFKSDAASVYRWGDWHQKRAQGDDLLANSHVTRFQVT